MHPHVSQANHSIELLLASFAMPDCCGMDPMKRARKTMSDLVVENALEKTWQIPAHGTSGPVTVVVRLPNVLIIDSRGRHILVAPEQADVVSTKMGEVADWLRNAAAG